MEFGVLGPLVAWRDGCEVPLGPPQQRAVLLVLLLRANQYVATATIVDELWGEVPPPRAVKTVQVYVSQLRKALGEDVIETRIAGYVLGVDPDALDLWRFERFVERGRVLLGTGASAEAARVLGCALDLWRGPPLAEFRFETFARPEVGRLEEMRLVAITLQVEADLALGRHAEVIPELEALIGEHPLRESLRELFILALYRAGRQADALAAYQDARAMLVDELGIEPSRSLRLLEKAVLVQDPALELAVAGRGVGLPVGTVTFLFADSGSEGELSGDWRRLVRAATSEAGGREVETRDGGLLVAFGRAGGAIRAAAEAQRRLGGERLPVRIGIHTGEPPLGPAGYLGAEVAKAALIGEAGHAGQVLVSASTRELVEAELRDDVALRDLGEHRLTNLTRPERLWQLVIHGVRSEFPSLRTLENRPTNLPVQPTPLIGRRRELAALAAQLRSAEVRLLTLTGPGGAGKTRLALQAAAELIEDFSHGVYLVALAPLSDPGLVLPAISQTLGLRESDVPSVAETLGSFLADRRVLLVLDNFEHVLAAAPPLGDLLVGAPGLKLLVTSRIPLHLAAERERPVPPLALPDPAHLPEFASLSQYEAVALFVERAQAVRGEFEVSAANAPALAELCVRLDGLPLAIELAAARVRLLSPQALLARLERRLDLLVDGPRDRPARQQTLRATIDWSHDLLEPEEQMLFASLAVFEGGWTLEAADAVCGGDALNGLAKLIDVNLVRQEEQTDGEPRFTMLETIRAYALERLEASDNADALRRRHARWFATIDERMVVEPRFGEVDWPVLARDLDNFRTALSALADHGERELLIRLVLNLQFIWIVRGHLREGAQWSNEAVKLAADLRLELKARAWECAGSFAIRLDDVDRAGELFEQALAARRTSEPGEVTEKLWITRMLGLVARKRGEYAQAEALFQQAATGFRACGEEKGLSVVLADQAQSALERGELTLARPLLEERLLTARERGFKDHVNSSVFDLGILALYERRYDDAGLLFTESLETALGQGDRAMVALALRGLAAIAAVRGELEPAARIEGAADAIDDQTGYRLERYERNAFAEPMRPVVESADNVEIAVARAAGRAMSEFAAVAYARAAVPTPAPP
jgi:predicted ATPase/DNA-binding SARP family transcriptional activator